MQIEDGKYFSPDVSNFVVKNGIGYTEHGEVFDQLEPMVIRFIPAHFVNDYSEWTPAQREEAKIAHVKACAEYEQERDNERTKRKALCGIAKGKLSEEEYGAVFSDGIAEGRGENDHN